MLWLGRIAEYGGDVDNGDDEAGGGDCGRCAGDGIKPVGGEAVLLVGIPSKFTAEIHKTVVDTTTTQAQPARRVHRKPIELSALDLASSKLCGISSDIIISSPPNGGMTVCTWKVALIVVPKSSLVSSSLSMS